MKILEIVFWILLGITFYVYIGYGVLIRVMVKIKSIFVRERNLNDNFLSTITCYEPNVYANETASLNTTEELKHKIRICAGGFQSTSRLIGLLNPFKNGLLTFQYLSHHLLRCIVVLFVLVLILVLNAFTQ